MRLGGKRTNRGGLFRALPPGLCQWERAMLRIGVCRGSIWRTHANTYRHIYKQSISENTNGHARANETAGRRQGRKRYSVRGTSKRCQLQDMHKTNRPRRQEEKKNRRSLCPSLSNLRVLRASSTRRHRMVGRVPMIGQPLLGYKRYVSWVYYQDGCPIGASKVHKHHRLPFPLHGKQYVQCMIHKSGSNVFGPSRRPARAKVTGNRPTTRNASRNAPSRV